MQYRIGAKVVITVTDNAANFVKAFRKYAADNSESSASAISPSENIVDDDNDELTFTDVTDLLSNKDDDSKNSLPQHQRCAAHTLNLVATSDEVWQIIWHSTRK